MLSRNTADRDASSLNTMREWSSPSSAAGGERCVASRVRLDCARFPHYRPSVVAPGHAGPTALIMADSPTLALTLLQTLPSGLLYRLLDLLGGRLHDEGRGDWILPSVSPVVLTPWVTGCCLEAQQSARRWCEDRGRSRGVGS